MKEGVSSSEVSVGASSSGSWLSGGSGVFGAEVRQLSRIYGAVSQHMMRLRQRKVQLLEEINYAVSTRMVVQAQIDLVEGSQFKQAAQLRQFQEQLLLKQLLLREQAQQKLKEQMRDMSQEQLEQKIRVNETARLELEDLQAKNQGWINQIEQVQSIISEQSIGTVEQLRIQVQQLKREKQGLLKDTKQQYDPRQLTIEQLIQVGQGLKWEQDQLNTLHNIAASEYRERSTEWLEQFIAEEQEEKELLMEDVQRLRRQKMKMQEENARMQQELNLS